jgi:hypothetical protein
MKTVMYLPLLILLFVLSACKKDEPLTVPVAFTETTYEPLGTWDKYGTPSYLLPKDSVSPEMLSYISNTLIEQSDLRETSPELLSTNAIADIAINKPSDVFITFVSQVTASRNAIAFYTYPTNAPPASAKDIKNIMYIFPNTGNGTRLTPGDKVKIGRFETETSIGFVLLKDAWNTTTKTVDSSAVHFCSNDVLNPEVDPALKKHAVLINYPAENKVLIGFENTNRTQLNCDHDFNDVVIYATVTP